MFSPTACSFPGGDHHHGLLLCAQICLLLCLDCYFSLHCFRQNQNLQIFFYCVVASTVNLGSTLLTNFEVQYSIVNYRYSVVQQISKTYSSYITETRPIKQQLPFPPFPSPWQPSPRSLKVSEMVVSLTWCRDNLGFPSLNYLDKSVMDIFTKF